MSIINTNYSASYTSKTKTVAAKPTKSETSSTEQTTVAKDVFTKSGVEGKENVTYSKPVKQTSVDADRSSQVKQLVAQNEALKESFVNMIREMVGQQANATYKQQPLGDLMSSVLGVNSTQGSLLENDDEWGVAAVAGRIMDMAEGFIGSDSSKFSMIKNAVLDGFAKAESVWGGKLPTVCYNTLDEINSRFDKLEERLFGSTEE